MGQENMESLVSKSEYIIREVTSRFKNPCVLFSGGKDSTVLLDLIRHACFGKIPMPVVFLDTTYQPKEVTDFIEDLRKEWGFNLIRATNKGAIKEGVGPKRGREECCHRLKTVALQDTISKYGFDAVLVGIRRDEHAIRNKEHYFSARDKDFRWTYARKKAGGDSGLELTQDAEFYGWDIFSTEFEGANHVRVHPLLHWNEKEVWEYILSRKLKVNPLYCARNGKRYRSLGCDPCTKPVDSDAVTVEQILNELETTKVQERSGRDKDKEEVMEKLRALGYM